MKSVLLRCALGSALFAVSCGGLVLDVGGEGAGGSPGAGGLPGAVQAGLPATSGCPTEEGFEKYLGDWFAEGPEPLEVGLERPPRTVRLHVSGVSRVTGVCGAIQLGEGPALPPPRYREEMYPDIPDGPGVGKVPLPGYFYTIVSGYPRGGGLDVSTVDKEIWKQWCALQSPVFDASGNALPMCLDDRVAYTYGTDFCYERGDTLVSHPPALCINCVRRRTCSCTAQGCGVNTTEHRHWAFEFHIEPGSSNPTLTLEEGGQVFVLEKLPAQ